MFQKSKLVWESAGWSCWGPWSSCPDLCNMPRKRRRFDKDNEEIETKNDCDSYCG